MSTMLPRRHKYGDCSLSKDLLELLFGIKLLVSFTDFSHIVAEIDPEIRTLILSTSTVQAPSYHASCRNPNPRPQENMGKGELYA